MSAFKRDAQRHGLGYAIAHHVLHERWTYAVYYR